MTYNLGLALLQAGKAREAFQTFSGVARTFAASRSPSFWLHMAEACIAIHADPDDVRMRDALVSGGGGSSGARVNTVTAVGANSHRKIILTSHKKPVVTATAAAGAGGSSAAPTFELANSCLQNAW